MDWMRKVNWNQNYLTKEGYELKTVMKPFQIKYIIKSEIRHGSPYNLVELDIVGKPNFIIERNNNWQNKHSWSKNGKFFAQVKWDLINNESGFKIILFDSEKGEIMESEHISGCCDKLKLTDSLDIEYETFTLISIGKKKGFGMVKGQVKTGYNNAL